MSKISFMISACIFDLDGVIVDTAKYHFKAWKRLAVELSGDLSLEQNEKLKGVSRMGSLEFIMQENNVQLTQEEKISLCAKKNDWYLESINEIDDSEILPGVLDFLNELKNKDLRIGLGSASKNAEYILKKVGIHHYFEVIIDGNGVTKSKPDPETFLLGAEALDVDPAQTIVFEDSIKGIQAANSGGFISVGVGDEKTLSAAEHNIATFQDLTPDQLITTIFSNRNI